MGWSVDGFGLRQWEVGFAEKEVRMRTSELLAMEGNGEM